MKDEIIIAIIGSGAFFTFIQFLINRYDNKNKILNKINYIEVGLTRMQLMVLMSDYPNRKEEVMKLAKKYFGELKGNFFLSSIFKSWLKKHKIKKPSWFTESNI